jgi:hypothetical protein
MAEKKSFLLRIDAHTLELLKRWADDDLRSLNGQIEFLLKRNLREAKRWKGPDEARGGESVDTNEET